jgi:hypothetical protein
MGKQAYVKRKRLKTLNHIHNWWQTEGKDMHANKRCPPLTCMIACSPN